MAAAFFLEAEGLRGWPATAANVVSERARCLYLLINNEVNENGERRSTLERFIRKHCEAGESDPETLTVSGLAYLKKLDELEKTRSGDRSPAT